jgi:hypothetical protein
MQSEKICSQCSRDFLSFSGCYDSEAKTSPRGVGKITKVFLLHSLEDGENLNKQIESLFVKAKGKSQGETSNGKLFLLVFWVAAE